jgi:hypothetical protein
MKRLPEKLVMAAVILSCGFVVQADPSRQQRPAKHSSQGSRYTWQLFPDGATAHHSPGGTSRSMTARTDSP